MKKLTPKQKSLIKNMKSRRFTKISNDDYYERILTEMIFTKEMLEAIERVRNNVRHGLSRNRYLNCLCQENSPEERALYFGL